MATILFMGELVKISRCFSLVSVSKVSKVLLNFKFQIIIQNREIIGYKVYIVVTKIFVVIKSHPFYYLERI